MTEVVSQRARSMRQRFQNYWWNWRRKGAAKMDHRLWFHWAITGRYPKG